MAKTLRPWKKGDEQIAFIGLLSRKSHLVSWQIESQTAMRQMCMAVVGPSAACFYAICHFYIWLTGVSEGKFIHCCVLLL